MKIITFTISLFFSSVAFCCSWAGDPTGGLSFMERAPKYIQEATYIFIGEIKEYDWRSYPDAESDFKWHYHKIRSLEHFKGNAPDNIDYWPATSCDEVFTDVGTKYVLFGYIYEGSIQFPLISGAISLDYAREIGLLNVLRDL